MCVGERGGEKACVGERGETQTDKECMCVQTELVKEQTISSLLHSTHLAGTHKWWA